MEKRRSLRHTTVVCALERAEDEPWYHAIVARWTFAGWYYSKKYRYHSKIDLSGLFRIKNLHAISKSLIFSKLCHDPPSIDSHNCLHFYLSVPSWIEITYLLNNWKKKLHDFLIHIFFIHQIEWIFRITSVWHHQERWILNYLDTRGLRLFGNVHINHL